jgi:hypothetical protein
MKEMPLKSNVGNILKIRKGLKITPDYIRRQYLSNRTFDIMILAF